jgi:hypothetical protein
MNMKTLLILLACLLGLSAQAQYRARPYSLYTTGTNSVMNANTNITHATTWDVAAGNSAILWMRYRLSSTNAAGTNPVTVRMLKGPTSSLFTNQFTFSVRAQTNQYVWDYTNVSVSDAIFLMHADTTNGNSISATNVEIGIIQKTGL